jgi:hypothetical protein
MAKFRPGNLILTATEKIIQGGIVVLDESRAGDFASLSLDASPTVQSTSFDTNINLGLSDTTLPTQKAVKDYVDSKISGSIQPADEYALARYDDSNGIQGSDISIDDLNNITGVLSLKFSSLISATVNEFSTDETLAGDSDEAVPTEKAVKAYVDSKISGSIADSTNWALARYIGEDGIQGSGITVDDDDNITGVESITAILFYGDGSNLTGTVSGDRGVISGSSTPSFLKYTGIIKTEGALYGGVDAPDGTTRLNFDGELYAAKIHNAVWNDVADFQKIIDEAIPGKCYYDTLEGAKICNERCQKSVIGILSDTYGIAVGNRGDDDHAPFAIAGWTLAYVDDICEPGDPLTCNETGNLSKMSIDEIRNYPERIVAIYKKPEKEELWGTLENKIFVNGRHWVKVK